MRFKAVLRRKWQKVVWLKNFEKCIQAEVLESDFEIDFCRNRFWNLNSKSDVKREIEIEVENKNRDRNRNRLPNEIEIEIEVGFEKEIEIEIEIDLQTKSRSKSKLRKEMALLLRF